MKRGDIVAFDYPFSDGTGSKIRPALVVQSNAIAGGDLILAMISGTSSSTSVPLDPTSTPSSGVKKNCYVRCEKLFSIDRKKVIGSIGYLGRKTLQQVDAGLRTALGL